MRFPPRLPPLERAAVRVVASLAERAAIAVADALKLPHRRHDFTYAVTLRPREDT